MLVPEEYREFFDLTLQEEFDVRVSFTREAWHGRMCACRGVGASMAEEVLKKWDAEHKKMLDEVVADEKTLEDLYVQPEYRGRADVRLDGVPDRGGHTSEAGRITRLIFSCSFVIVVFVSVRIT